MSATELRQLFLRISPGAYGRLEELAALERRSVRQQATLLLERAVGQGEVRKDVGVATAVQAPVPPPVEPPVAASPQPAAPPRSERIYSPISKAETARGKAS